MGERSVYHDGQLDRHRPRVELATDRPGAGWPEKLPAAELIAQTARRVLAGICALDALRMPVSGETCAFGLNITIEDDEGIARINQDQRGKTGATDVLSFPMFEFPPGPGTAGIDGETLRAALEAWPRSDDDAPFELGDIVISHECCVRQAAEIGHSVTDEFQRLLVHGILHLFGYDHETSAADGVRMREREDRLLSELDA